MKEMSIFKVQMALRYCCVSDICVIGLQTLWWPRWL